MQGKHFKKHLLDENYDKEKNYFFKELSKTGWVAIREFLVTFFTKGKTEEKVLETFFHAYPALKKGAHHVTDLRKIVDEVATENKGLETFLESYQAINNFVAKEYMMAKPAILQALFFPSDKNEDKMVNMLRTCKRSLDICVFNLTNDKIFAAIEEVWNEGVDVRIITDDKCCTNPGSDVYKMAAMGVPVKTDNSLENHMHHKFCIIDEAVVITGSFNWTTQAVMSNQENIVFIENEYLAVAYGEEYEKLWNGFKTAIDVDEGITKSRKQREESQNYYKSKK